MKGKNFNFERRPNHTGTTSTLPPVNDDSWIMDLGTNIIVNCDAALVVNGVEVFRIKERRGNGQIVCDFEVRNEDGELLAKIAGNNVVHKAIGIEATHGVNYSEVRSSATGETLARAEEVALRFIRLRGMFCVGETRVLSTDRYLAIETTEARVFETTGGHFEGFKRAIEISKDRLIIGVLEDG